MGNQVGCKQHFYNPFSSRNTEQALNPAYIANVERLLTIVRGNRLNSPQFVFCQNGRFQIFQNL